MSCARYKRKSDKRIKHIGNVQLHPLKSFSIKLTTSLKRIENAILKFVIRANRDHRHNGMTEFVPCLA